MFFSACLTCGPATLTVKHTGRDPEPNRFGDILDRWEYTLEIDCALDDIGETCEIKLTDDETRQLVNACTNGDFADVVAALDNDLYQSFDSIVETAHEHTEEMAQHDDRGNDYICCWAENLGAVCQEQRVIGEVMQYLDTDEGTARRVLDKIDSLDCEPRWHQGYWVGNWTDAIQLDHWSSGEEESDLGYLFPGYSAADVLGLAAALGSRELDTDQRGSLLVYTYLGPDGWSFVLPHERLDEIFEELGEETCEV